MHSPSLLPLLSAQIRRFYPKKKTTTKFEFWLMHFMWEVMTIRVSRAVEYPSDLLCPSFLTKAKIILIWLVSFGQINLLCAMSARIRPIFAVLQSGYIVDSVGWSGWGWCIYYLPMVGGIDGTQSGDIYRLIVCLDRKCKLEGIVWSMKSASAPITF